MEFGTTINREGTSWIIDSVIKETNRRFQWFKVVAHWSGFGPMPNWSTEQRTFLMGRQKMVK
jgi:hypothetical protein